MKLSISLPDKIAGEIRGLAKRSDRSISWWIQRAWMVARERLHNPSEQDRAARTAIARLEKLEGALKPFFKNHDSVELSHQAFRHKK